MGVFGAPRPRMVDPFVCFALSLGQSQGHLEKLPFPQHGEACWPTGNPSTKAWVATRPYIPTHRPSIASSGLHIPTSEPSLPPLRSHDVFFSFSLVFCPIFAALCHCAGLQPGSWTSSACRGKNEVLQSVWTRISCILGMERL